MNIAIVSPEFPPVTNWGGVATFNYQLAKLLSSQSHRVFVFTLGKDLSKTKIVKTEGMTIIYISYKTNKFFLKYFYKLISIVFSKHFPRLFQIISWNIFSSIEFRKWDKTSNFKVIHAPSYQSPTVLIGISQKQKIFLHVHGPQVFLNKYERVNLDIKLVTYLENLSMRFLCLKTISCSKFMKDKLIKRFPKFRTKTITIANFLDDEKFDYHLPDVNKLVYWGRLERRKGVDILLKAFTKLAEKNSKLQLYLVGSPNGTFRHKGVDISFDLMLEAIVQPRFRNRIHRISYIYNRKELFSVLNKIKGIAISPSFYEPFGMVTIEAMSLGYLAVASRNGGGSEIIDPFKNGFLVKPQVFSIIQTIKKIQALSDESKKEIVKKARLDFREKYSFSVASDRYKSLYKETLNLI